MSQKLLQLENVTIGFKKKKKTSLMVRDMSFTINEEETVCIVGESGSGKSLTAFSIMGLLPKPGEIVSGTIHYKDIQLNKLNKEELRKIRGNEVSMIFQEPMTALNPSFTIGFQIREAIRNHKNISKKEANMIGIGLLRQVEIPSPEQRMKQYPHELSGGMRQRVMIAIALACQPKILIADEPTTALDVTIQAQILDLINALKGQEKMGVLLITHDMGVVAEVADKVIVMYSGEIVEEGDCNSIFNNPKHPYTKALLESVPHVDERKEEIKTLPGSVISNKVEFEGCIFQDRCPLAMEQCKLEKPPKTEWSKAHYSKCWAIK